MHEIDSERFDRTMTQCWQVVDHRPKLPQHKNFVLAWIQKQTEKSKEGEMAKLFEPPDPPEPSSVTPAP